MRGFLIGVAVCLTTGLSVVPAGAQNPPTPPLSVTRSADSVTVRAIRLTAPLKLDGQLDEAVYTDNMPVDGFTQQEPREGQPATEATQAWVMFDDNNLYIGARNFDSQSDRMVLNDIRHDSNSLIQNEQLTVILDTFHDKRNGFLFLVNALGGMLEETFVDERNNSRDWNTVWDAKTARFDGGWTVEMQIPFKSLRYQPGQGQTWGLNMNRIIKWKNERTWLAPMPAAYGTGVFRISKGANLIGLDPPPLAKNLEVKPYAIGGLTTDRTAKPAFSNRGSKDAGFDVKYGLTRGLTADLTVNTDFAQVEEDEQQVNLTRFSLFFPEKREFFLENQGAFTIGPPVTNTNLVPFFSRTIGLSDTGSPIPIVGGARLTGKVGRSSLALLNMQTEDEVRPGNLSTLPAANFTVLRYGREFLNN